MPDADVDIVRSIYDEFNATLALPAETLRRDVEWHPPGDEPDNASRHGVEAVRAYVSEWVSSFDDYHVTIDELFERNERVVAVIALHGRIHEGSAELRQPL